MPIVVSVSRVVHADAPAAPAEAPVSPRSRLRQALVCPYCKDDVGRRGAVVCARRGCGAFYHRECWEECATRYGGCAIYGCASKRSREISAAGYFLRFVRLFLATILFPKRLARAIVANERENLSLVYERALATTRATFPTLGRVVGWGPLKVELAVLALLTALFFFLVFWNRGEVGKATGATAGIVVFLVQFLFLLNMFTFVPILGFALAKFAAKVFAGEVAALVRGDEGGGTVLGRIRLGGGKKG